jgi:hypothetical protein
LPELKTFLPSADLAIEGYVDPRELLRDEGPFGNAARSATVAKGEAQIQVRDANRLAMVPTQPMKTSFFRLCKTSSRMRRKEMMNPTTRSREGKKDTYSYQKAWLVS